MAATRRQPTDPSDPSQLPGTGYEQEGQQPGDGTAQPYVGPPQFQNPELIPSGDAINAELDPIGSHGGDYVPDNGLTTNPNPTQPAGTAAPAPTSDPYAAVQQPQAAPGGSVGSTAGSNLNSTLSSFLTNPTGYNQDVMRRRVEGAREDIEGQRSASLDTIMAQLAERGLLGSGPEATARMRLNDKLNSNMNSAVQGIYADESSKADDRLVQLLSLATGMSMADAKNAVDMFGINSQHDLGMSQIGENWDEFQANYGLDAQRLAYDQQNGGIDQLIAILRQLGILQ